MAKLSSNGLGAAGNEAGRIHLEELARRLPEEDPQLWRFLKPNVEEAIQLSRRIEQYGYQPDSIETDGNSVKLRLTTPEVDKVTERDYAAAVLIDLTV